MGEVEHYLDTVDDGSIEVERLYVQVMAIAMCYLEKKKNCQKQHLFSCVHQIW